MTVITVGGTTPVFEAEGQFLDGQSADIRKVGMTIHETPQGPILMLTRVGMQSITWPLDTLRTVPDQADRDSIVLAMRDDPVARLIVTDADARRILRARAPMLKKRPPAKGKVRILGWSLAAIASVVLIIFVLVPVMADQLAEYLPPEGEKALGDATYDQIRAALSDDPLDSLAACENATGVAALSAMQAKLEAQTDLPYDLSVHVLNHSLINAFALPGGHIVFFRGLIDEAETADEVAAVFAHEIGHVANRDPARGALRSAGSIGVLGLIFGDFAGGAAVLFMVERLIEATYSREAEAAADAFAHEVLAGAGVPPAALATFFERLREKFGETDGLVAHFMAHPALVDRITAAQSAQGPENGAISPILTQTQWQALKQICD